jgi:hypothetical protein
MPSSVQSKAERYSVAAEKTSLLGNRASGVLGSQKPSGHGKSRGCWTPALSLVGLPLGSAYRTLGLTTSQKP